ncbi:MAG: calcium-translocating P-type ATPase, PMCA-type [Bacilli bacterium]|nr:calcium-translocating P-type ATPase, PMCA-type [Bacilli bacterium]
MKIGLTDKEVKVNKDKYGTNELPNPKRRTILNLIIESFGDPIIKILLIALAIKIVFLFKDYNWYETLGILIAIFLATLISTLSEYGSEEAFKKLQDENKDIIVKTFRNNYLTNIKSSEIVVGDIILLESGDIIPADARLIDGNILVDESMLTGESKLQEKKLNNNKEVKLYKGTVCYEGTAKCTITSVGINTLYGNIAKEIVENNTISPLKKRLVHLSKIINKIGYVGAILVVFSYLFSVIFISNNFDKDLITKYITNKKIINDLIYALTLCVTTIVVAVPEGLPMMITLVLSSNMKRLIKSNVLVRKMVGIETSGNISYLLTDKTGTITKGKLNCISYISGDLVKYNSISNLNNDYKSIIVESLLYNSSSTYNSDEIIGGNTTDRAILEFIKDEIFEKKEKYKYIPFNSDNKYSEVFINNHNYIKGAYDKLLPLCNYYLDHNNNLKKININIINNYIKTLTTKGLRVIANIDKHDDKVIFLGLIIIKDEIRKESVEGIKKIKNAGINVIMITGDHNDTAISVAKEVGIYEINKSISLTSEELNKLSYEEIFKIIDNVKVISRAMPSDKSKLVRILQDKGYVVGMTGDGVNDAPALKKADVGFSMGSGTSVAKEASDIVILDNNLLSISKAILFGRTIFKNIRKFIVYQLSVNFCALTLSIIGPFIGVIAPITITQMLWLNMIMDTFAGLAFSFEPSFDKYLTESPISKNEPVINKKMYLEIAVNGLYSAFLCIIFLKLPLIKKIINPSNKYFMTSYFALFIFLGIFNAFSSRTSSINIFKNINLNKPFLFLFIFIFIAQILIIYLGGNIFGTYGMSVHDLIFVLILSTTTLIVNTIRKIYIKKRL